jgi:hypothetical protein
MRSDRLDESRKAREDQLADECSDIDSSDDGCFFIDKECW